MVCLLKFKKLLTSILLTVILIPLTVSPVRAFDSGPDNTYAIQFYNAVFRTQEMNLQSFVYETMRAVVMSVVTFIIGNPSDYGIDSETEAQQLYDIFLQYMEKMSQEAEDSIGEEVYNFPNNSALISIAQLMTTAYTHPPASGVTYLASIGRKLNLISPAYAQESKGWQKMDDVLPIWKSFRNVSYMLFVIIMVFMGFMIMFRVKISPQAIINIQNALPKIILGVILITFSYAIVGFLVDIMYVLINVIITIFSSLEGSGKDMSALYLKVPTTSDLGIIVNMLLLGFIPLTIALVVVLILAIAIGGPIGVIIGVIVAIVLLVALIRVLWSLLKAYINVLLALIFSPFIILIGVLPGSKTVGSWFKNLISNLAIWPTVLVIVYLASYLAIKGIINVFEGGNLFFNLVFIPLIALGLLLMTPRVSDLVKAFMSGQSFNYGTAIGETLSSGVKMPYQASTLASTIGKGIDPNYTLGDLPGLIYSGTRRGARARAAQQSSQPGQITPP